LSETGPPPERAMDSTGRYGLPRAWQRFSRRLTGSSRFTPPSILAGYKCPVMMDGARPANVPLSEDLRIDSLVSKYGPMFQFSYDYMAAFALESGVKDITLYGIDLATEEEYAKKRLSFYYWIGMLRGSGATVNVSAGSLILSRRWVYCHERDVLSDAGARLEKLADDKLAEWQAKEDEARLAVAFSNGYKQCAQDMTRIGE
jgi:hypothetical protein